jgi:hypothetical protein
MTYYDTRSLLRGSSFEKAESVTHKKDIAEIERMLKALIKSLENKPLNSTPWPRPINLARLSITCHHYEA